MGSHRIQVFFLHLIRLSSQIGCLISVFITGVVAMVE